MGRCALLCLKNQLYADRTACACVLVGKNAESGSY